MAIKLNKLIREFNPDLIISTHPFSSQMCAVLKKQEKISCKIATVMTDFKSHDQWLVGSNQVDYFFVSNENMKQELIDKNIDISKIHVTGIPVSDKFLINYNKEEFASYLNAQIEQNNKEFYIRYESDGTFDMGNVLYSFNSSYIDYGQSYRLFTITPIS